eukprot:5392314-Pyramimonas_sp.AAC.1
MGTASTDRGKCNNAAPVPPAPAAERAHPFTEAGPVADPRAAARACAPVEKKRGGVSRLSLIHISEPTRPEPI